MKDIIRVEIKRILNKKIILIISIIVLIYSIFSSITSLNKYNIYDSSGNLIISSKENLRESKKDKHNIVLNEKTIKDVVERKDKSKYLYNSILTTLIGSNYEKNVEDITDEDIKNFYNKRIENVKANLGGTALVERIEAIGTKAKQLNAPIKLGYAEGWKNLNSDITDFITVIIFIIPFILLPLFGQESKSNMKQLYTATKYGKWDLIKSRVITGIGVGTIIYIISLLVFSICKLIVFGFNGANLPIQSSAGYLFSPYNITYFQQYLINTVIGFVAMLMLVGLVLFTTVITSQLLSSAVIIMFTLIVMTMLPNNNFELNHYFKNFLPYSMTNFNSYYFRPEVYSLFGNLVPTYILVIVIGLIVFGVLMLGATVISYIQLKRKLY